eukprot:4586726-Amphidinium_carterae.1
MGQHCAGEANRETTPTLRSFGLNVLSICGAQHSCKDLGAWPALHRIAAHALDSTSKPQGRFPGISCNMRSCGEHGSQRDPAAARPCQSFAAQSRTLTEVSLENAVCCQLLQAVAVPLIGHTFKL